MDSKKYQKEYHAKYQKLPKAKQYKIKYYGTVKEQKRQEYTNRIRQFFEDAARAQRHPDKEELELFIHRIDESDTSQQITHQAKEYFGQGYRDIVKKRE
jgi:hypothetical protein